MSEIFDCPSCRASLNYTPSDSPTIKCDYCGNTVIVPEGLRQKKETIPTPTPIPNILPPHVPPPPISISTDLPDGTHSHKAVWLGRIGLLLVGLSLLWPELTWNPSQAAFLGALLRLLMFAKQRRWGWFFIWLLLLPICSLTAGNDSLGSPPLPTTVLIESPITPPPQLAPTLPPPTRNDPNAMQGCVAQVSSLNVRSGPGATYEAVAFLYEGDCLEFDAQSADGQWLRISQPDPLQGQWLFAQFIESGDNLTELPIAPSP